MSRDLDHEWLVERYEELHSLSASSRKRNYIRGRIDEYRAQNAITPGADAIARAEALGNHQTKARQRPCMICGQPTAYSVCSNCSR